MKPESTHDKRQGFDPRCYAYSLFADLPLIRLPCAVSTEAELFLYKSWPGKTKNPATLFATRRQQQDKFRLGITTRWRNMLKFMTPKNFKTKCQKTEAKLFLYKLWPENKQPHFHHLSFANYDRDQEIEEKFRLEYT